MKKYIIQNLNFAAPYPGNLMRSIFALESICKEKDIEFIYVFPTIARQLYWVQEMIAVGKTLYFKPKKNINRFWIKIVKMHTPYAVHTHFWNLKDCLFIKFLKLKHPRIKTIIHHHAYYFQSRKKFNELIKRVLLDSDYNIACSYTLSDLLKSLKFNNVICAENAIDYRRLDKYDVLCRNEYGIKENTKVFLAFGHDFHIKGIDIAIRAMEKFHKEHDAILAIVIAKDIELCEKKIRDLLGYCPDWIKILPPRDDVATYYHFSDVFISSSRQEGFCYALPEAAYAGCRIIFSEIPGQAHAQNIPNGLSFETENINSLLSAMENALLSFDIISQKTYVQNHYCMETWCKETMRAYE